MLKIGEFSKMAHMTIKALRYYEKEGLLIPAGVDKWSGYRFYETSQLEQAARIKACRQLGLSVEETRRLLSGADAEVILREKEEALRREKRLIETRLSIIKYLLQEDGMKYQVSEKLIPETLVYSAETVLKSYEELMTWVPSVGAACMALNPGIKCAEPPYEFCEYLDEDYREADIRVRHSEAVTVWGREDDNIRFHILPAARVLSLYHRGSYERMGEAFAFIMNYAEQNGYRRAGLVRACYIDGIWNRESEEDWLTEIQLPVE